MQWWCRASKRSRTDKAHHQSRRETTGGLATPAAVWVAVVCCFVVAPFKGEACGIKMPCNNVICTYNIYFYTWMAIIIPISFSLPIQKRKMQYNILSYSCLLAHLSLCAITLLLVHRPLHSLSKSKPSAVDSQL